MMLCFINSLTRSTLDRRLSIYIISNHLKNPIEIYTPLAHYVLEEQIASYPSYKKVEHQSF